MDAAAEHTKACLWSWDPGALQSAVRFLDGELSKAGFDARRVWDLSTAAAVANGKLAVVHVAKPQSVQRFATRALNIFHYWERIDVRATYSSPALLMSRAQALYASNVSSVSSDDMAPCLGALQVRTLAMYSLPRTTRRRWRVVATHDFSDSADHVRTCRYVGRRHICRILQGVASFWEGLRCKYHNSTI